MMFNASKSSRRRAVLLCLTGDWQLSAHGGVFDDYRRSLRVRCAARVFFFFNADAIFTIFSKPKMPFWKGRGECCLAELVHQNCIFTFNYNNDSLKCAQTWLIHVSDKWYCRNVNKRTRAVSVSRAVARSRQCRCYQRNAEVMEF